MITVEFSYKNKFGKWLNGERVFQTVTSAIRFIKYVIPKRNMVYLGFSSWDSELTEEMNYRL